jgi:hypothetical protein
MNRPCGKVSVDISILKTFNGPQRYVVRSDKDVIAYGTITNAATLSFKLEPKDRQLGFEIELPDACKVSDVRPQSRDARVVALQIREIRLASEE